MQKHVEVYRKYFSYGDQDIVLCEVCGRGAVDIHHIHYRSRGGDNDITNLMALCRSCHDLAHQEKLTEDYLRGIHLEFMDYSINGYSTNWD